MYRLALYLLLPLAVASAAGTLVIPANPVNFIYQRGGVVPTQQLVPIQSIGDALRFTATAASEGNWLKLGIDNGLTPSSISVSVDITGLAVGSYQGFLTISAQGASNNPRLLQVNLLVLAGTTLSVSTTQLNFNYRAGSSAPPTQQIAIASSGASLDFTAAAASQGNWLQATASGATPGTVTVRANPEALGFGTFAGTIVIGSTSAVNDPFTINVNLTVSPAQTLIVATTPLVFNFASAAVTPSAQTLLIGSNLSALGFTVAPAGGAAWLTTPTGAGTAPAFIEVRATPAGLPAGTYSSSIFITSFGVQNSPVVVPVTMTIAATAPVVAIGGIVNSASSSAAALAPGSLFTIYGTRFGTVFANTKVDVSGLPAPLTFLSDGQINAQMPFEIEPGEASVFVTVNGIRSKAGTITVSAVAPGLFLVAGTNRALAQNQDYSLNDINNPARPGTYLTAYLTGQGELDNAVPTGAVAPASPLSRPKAAVSATIGGAPAPIYFAGLTPGLIGVCQVNVQIPDIAAGEVPLLIKIGPVFSNSALLIIGR